MSNNMLVRPLRKNLLLEATDGVTDPVTRQQLIKQAASIANGWRYLLLYLLIAVGGGMFLISILFLFFLRLQSPEILLLLLYVVFIPTFAALAIVFQIRRSHRECRALARILYDYGLRPRFCLRCRYDLRGMDSIRCPECGEPLAPANDASTARS